MDTSKKSIWIIINPVSGTRSKKNIPPQIKAEYENIFDLQFFITEYPGHASELALLAVEAKVNMVIAVGGDGTINETAKSLIGSDVVLAILPLGSGNGLARSLQIPMKVQQAIKMIGSGNVRTIDYGKANDHIFLCTCGIGYDAYVSEKALNQSKRGKLMYAKNMLTAFAQFKPEKYRVVTKDVDIEHDSFVVTCANAPQYGNDAFIAPNANMEDGLMHITFLLPVKAYHVARIGAQMFTNNLLNNKKMIEIVSQEATIYRQKEGVMHLDGNAIYEGKEIHVQIIKHGLKVLVPANYTEGMTSKQRTLKNMTKWI